VSSPLPPPRAPPPTPQPAELPTGQRSSRSERRPPTNAATTPSPPPCWRWSLLRRRVGQLTVRPTTGSRPTPTWRWRRPASPNRSRRRWPRRRRRWRRLWPPSWPGSEDPDLVEDILLQSKRDGLRNERVYGQQAT
jgi:hypothetical protein